MPRPFGKPHEDVLDAGTFHETWCERFASLVLAFYAPVQLELRKLVMLRVRDSPGVDVFRRFLI